jgi:hypothetical protein
MSHALARQAIETKLSTWANARPIKVSYGGSPITVSVNDVYLRAFQLPSATVTPTLAGEVLEYRGLYQISIVLPANTPHARAEAIISELNALFPVDSDLIQGAFLGMVTEPVSQGPDVFEDSTYTVPATFSYRGQA